MNSLTVEGILTADPALVPGSGRTMPVCIFRLAIDRPAPRRAHDPILISVTTTGADALKLVDSARRGDLVEVVGRLESLEITRDCGGRDLSVWVVATGVTVFDDPF